MASSTKYYAHGKLLITGEYLVLDGAMALAIPTKLGQSLEVNTFNIKNQLEWKSYDINQQIWFHCLLTPTFEIKETNDLKKSNRLISLLKETVKLNPEFSNKLFGSSVITQLEFDILAH